MRYQWRGLPVRRTPPVRYGPRSLPAVVIPLFIAVAVLGYVVGHARSGGGSSETLRTAKSAHVLIEYPIGWKPAASITQIPGLAIEHPQLIVPRARHASAGLIVGTLPAGELGPLPRGFISGLSRLPQTTVVDLVEAQAYRYAAFSGRALQEPLVVFVIPNPGGHPTALACYAPSQGSRYMRQCEQAVSGVTVVGQVQVYRLAPEPEYAARISTAILPLDRLRVALKRELQPQITAERAQQLATRLAAGFAQASTSLSNLEAASAAAQPVQAALASSVQRARDGYTALAGAASERDASAYTAAQKRIAAAESDVDWALENFVLLGYSSALGGSAPSPS
jgi:hypothetical protein